VAEGEKADCAARHDAEQKTKCFAKRGDIRLGERFLWSLLRLCLHRDKSSMFQWDLLGRIRFSVLIDIEQKKMEQETKPTARARQAWSAALVQEEGPGITPGINLPPSERRVPLL